MFYFRVMLRCILKEYISSYKFKVNEQHLWHDVDNHKIYFSVPLIFLKKAKNLGYNEATTMQVNDFSS